MTDSQLRELERRFRSSGRTEDEVALLSARMRVGLLEQTKVELAVYLGSRAAQEILGSQAPKYTKPPKTGVNGFVRKGLSIWGPMPCLRAAIAASRMIVSDKDDLPDEVCRVRVHLAEAYAVDQRADILDEMKAQPRIPLPTESRWRKYWWVCTSCGWTLSTIPMGGTHCAWKAKDTVAHVSTAIGDPAAVRAAIVAELLPWTLGYSDPVRERVEARLHGGHGR